MFHVQLVADAKDWLAWAYENQLHPWVIDYISQRPDHLFTEPPKTEEPYSTPRSWHMLSDALKEYGAGQRDVPEETVRYLAYGSVSASHAGQFLAFVKQLGNRDILKDIISGEARWPSKPEERDVLYFVAQSFAQDYIDALNANGEWVTYDEASNTATITSIADFVKAFKSASKNLGAFDQLDGGQGENTLFGYGDGSGAHFDSALADILNSLGSSYANDYSEDLSKTDSVGNTVDTRLNMYTPLYYLLESSEGYGTSTIAKYWRIRTGIAQSDCALSTEMNLALALENTEGVQNVDFETVWGAGHTEAERTGDSTTNFIEWVNECMKK